MMRASVAAAALALSLSVTTGCDTIREQFATESPTPAPPTAVPSPTPIPPPPLPPNPQALLRWDDLPVTFCVSPDSNAYVPPTDFVAAAERAFAAWGVAYQDEGLCGPPTPDDGINTIGWGPLSTAQHPGRTFEAGLTQTLASECTANCDPDDRVRLVEADVTIDIDPPGPFRTADCLYSTLLHEVGHFLGVDHLPAPAIMAPQTSECPQELTPADREALFLRYGQRVQG